MNAPTVSRRAAADRVVRIRMMMSPGRHRRLTWLVAVNLSGGSAERIWSRARMDPRPLALFFVRLLREGLLRLALDRMEPRPACLVVLPPSLVRREPLIVGEDGLTGRPDVSRCTDSLCSDAHVER